MRKPNRQIEIALQRNPTMVARFWSQVDRSEETTACWEWTGRCNQDKPVFQVRGSSIAPARITWLWSTGAFPSGGRLYHSCANSLCVRPSHLIWVVGRVVQQRLEAESDGYIGVSGLALSLDLRPRYWPQVVRVTDAEPEHERMHDLPCIRLRDVAESKPLASSA